MKQYYLTKSSVIGTEFLSMCASGFHMAQILEIETTTLLRYNSLLGQTSPDSGFGPPFGYAGWVRSGAPGPGWTCDAWQSNSPSATGTRAILAYPGNEAGRAMFGHWAIDHPSCNTRLPVWCTQD
jgi:hypothetical protein